MPETILLTGGSGFVGGAVVRALRAAARTAGSRLVLISDASSLDVETIPARRDPRGRYGFSRADLTAAGVAKVDRVVHIGAAMPKSGAEVDDPVAAMANVANLEHLLETLPETPARFVFASTIDVYGVAATGLAEDHPCQPASLYGAAKLFGERWLAAAFKATGSLQILRLGHIYGPGEDAFRKFIPESIRRLHAGDSPHFITDGRERRSFLHVDDCARMIVAALFAEQVSGPINLASARAVSLREVASILCDVHNQATRSTVVPTFADDPRPGVDVTADSARMRALLGEERITLEAGLREEYLAMAPRR